MLLYGSNDETDENGTKLCIEDSTLDNFVDSCIIFDVELNRVVKRIAELEISKCDVVEETTDPVNDAVLERLGIFENALNCDNSVSLALVLSGILLIMLNADVWNLVGAIVLISEFFIDVNVNFGELERRLSLELFLPIYDCGVALDPKLPLDAAAYNGVLDRSTRLKFVLTVKSRMLDIMFSLDCETEVVSIISLEYCELKVELPFVVTANTEELQNEVGRKLVVHVSNNNWVIVVEGMYSPDGVTLDAAATEVRSKEPVELGLDVTKYEFGEKCFKEATLDLLGVTDNVVDETAIVESLVEDVGDGISKVRVTTDVLNVSTFAELLCLTIVIKELSNCV